MVPTLVEVTLEMVIELVPATEALVDSITFAEELVIVTFTGTFGVCARLTLTVPCMNSPTVALPTLMLGAVTVAERFISDSTGTLKAVGGAVPPIASVGAPMLTVVDPPATGWNIVESKESPGLNTTGLVVIVPMPVGLVVTATSNGPM